MDHKLSGTFLFISLPCRQDNTLWIINSEELFYFFISLPDRLDSFFFVKLSLHRAYVDNEKSSCITLKSDSHHPKKLALSTSMKGFEK